MSATQNKATMTFYRIQIESDSILHQFLFYHHVHKYVQSKDKKDSSLKVSVRDSYKGMNGRVDKIVDCWLQA